MDGKAFIFLNGRYSAGDQQIVKRLLRRARSRPVLIAVDGGISFLQNLSIKPDYWISDLDSTPRIRRGFLKETETLFYPGDKDKTDAQLSIDVCILDRLTDVSIFDWDARQGEIDHLLGNLFLFRTLRAGKSSLRLRFLDSRREIIALRDQAMRLSGYKGFRLSIVPVSPRISLTLRGTRYAAQNLVVREGETISLRNLITAQRASIEIKGAGLAIIMKAGPDP